MSSKIKITSDSTIDIPDEMLEANGISIVPFNIILGDTEYLDRIDVTPDTIYKYVAEKKILPKTAAVNMVTLTDFFEPILEEYDEIVHISLSSKISATYSNACLAAKGNPNIHIIDGKTLSTGTALLTLYAADLAKSGHDAKTIVEKVTFASENLQVSFVVDTMEYLHKGGRCTGLAAFIASRLSIKPTIVMHTDGMMRPGKKYMAKINKAILKYVDETLEEYNTPDLTRIFITHTSADPDIVEQVRERIREHFPFREIIETVAGSTITSHCGQGTLGILYVNTPLR